MMVIKAVAVISIIFVTTHAWAADWRVFYRNDEMRGTSQKIMINPSDNSVDFSFPYNGGSVLSIVLRSDKIKLKANQKSDDLKLSEALILISSGQFNCNSYDECHISAKFDDGPVLHFSMTEAEGGSTNSIFFDQSGSFIKKIREHKKLIIEAPFFQEGDKQFKFDLTGFSSPKVDN